MSFLVAKVRFAVLVLAVVVSVAVVVDVGIVGVGVVGVVGVAVVIVVVVAAVVASVAVVAVLLMLLRQYVPAQNTRICKQIMSFRNYIRIRFVKFVSTFQRQASGSSRHLIRKFARFSLFERFVERIGRRRQAFLGLLHQALHEGCHCGLEGN